MATRGTAVVLFLALAVASAAASDARIEFKAGDLVNGYTLVHQISDPAHVRRAKALYGIHHEEYHKAQGQYKYAQTLLSIREKTERPGDGPIYLSAGLRNGYNFEKFIAEGGFGVIWKATKNGETVAMKCYATSQLGSTASRRKEAYDDEIAHINAIWSIRDDHSEWFQYRKFIIKMLDNFVHDKNGVYEYFTVWPFAEGTFENVAKKTLTVDQYNVLSATACAGVSYLQHFMFTHGDIKPENFFYRTNADGNYEAILADPGLVQGPNPSTEYACGPCGSLGWFSPEASYYDKAKRNRCIALLRTIPDGKWKFDAFATGASLYAVAAASTVDSGLSAVCGTSESTSTTWLSSCRFKSGAGCKYASVSKQPKFIQAIEGLTKCSPVSRITSKQCVDMLKEFIPGTAAAAVDLVGPVQTVPEPSTATGKFVTSGTVWMYSLMNKLNSDIKLAEKLALYVDAMGAAVATASGKTVAESGLVNMARRMEQKFRIAVAETTTFASEVPRTNLAKTKAALNELLAAVEAVPSGGRAVEAFRNGPFLHIVQHWCSSAVNDAEACKAIEAKAMALHTKMQKADGANLEAVGLDDLVPCVKGLIRAAQGEVEVIQDTINLATAGGQGRQCAVCVSAVSLWTYSDFDNMACSSASAGAGNGRSPASWQDLVESGGGLTLTRDWFPVAKALKPVGEDDLDLCRKVRDTITQSRRDEVTFEGFKKTMRSTSTRGPRFMCNKLEMCPFKAAPGAGSAWNDA